jgi:hypothetical protein
VHDHVAGAQLGHQRRVAVEHLEVAVLRGQLDRNRRVIEERALGSDQPDAKLICSSAIKLLSSRSALVSATVAKSYSLKLSG